VSDSAEHLTHKRKEKQTDRAKSPREWRQAKRPERKAGSVQLPTETSPYVQYDNLEDYKMRRYSAQGHLPVSDVPHGGFGTDAPTMPGTNVPVAKLQQQDQGREVD
jgi:hypothetical protein